MADIKTIGVCGAGVMGSQLAAFFASAGYEVELFDLTQELAEKGFGAAKATKPPAFYHQRFANRITVGNYGEHLDRLELCDWVIEAIGERLDWKHDLYGKIAPHLKSDAVLTSNTSGLFLEDLVSQMDPGLKERFFITHFFNPPRYMRLVEIIQGEATRPDLVNDMVSFIGTTLGKGIVYAKDTPNFIANRIGIYGMMLALRITEARRLTVEQVDALTGPVMGRPKSATFRTADLVGLDTMALVAQTSYDKCPDDEARDIFQPPEILQALIGRGTLGQKSKAGFYKKGPNRGEILALDFKTLEYRAKEKVRMDGIGVARRYTDLGKKLNALIYNPDAAGEAAWELTIGTLAYTANRLGEIADDIVNIDRAMKWGYAWQMGPFEMWDAIGVEKSVRRMEAESKPVPALVTRMLESGQESFYGRNGTGHRTYFDVRDSTPRDIPAEKGVVVLSDVKAAGGEISRNWSASLVDLGDGVACLEFHSALQPEFNPIDGAILDMLFRSLQTVGERGLKGLVISHDGVHFCAGANLALILELARTKQFHMIDFVSKTLQDLTQMIKYAPFPVVAAPFSVCLGGAFEIIGPCDEVVPLSELYCGAVEVGVGLIPGGGGNLRHLIHMDQRYPTRKHGPMFTAQKSFEVIAFAKVSGSAYEAIELGYLREDSPIVLSRDHQIGTAKGRVLELADEYQPPEPAELVLPGEGGRLAIESALTNFHKSGAILDHDIVVSKKLAYVITGGDRANGIDKLDEQYLLDIEREAFVSLAGEPKTQDRMAHMLKTGKPLRN